MAAGSSSLSDIDRELAEIEGHAAATVQRAWRKKEALWAALEREVAELEAEEAAQLDGAAATIQKVWRGGCARQRLGRLMDQELAWLECGGGADRERRAVADAAPRPGSLPVTPVKLPGGGPADTAKLPGDPDDTAKAQLSELCSRGKLSDSYRLGSVIGTGGQSTVRQARCLRTGKDFAVKSLPKATSDHEAVLKECTIMMTLRHQPGVLQLVALYDSGSHHDLVLEYMQGGDLFSLFIKSHSDKQQQRRRRILNQLALDNASVRRHSSKISLQLTAADQVDAGKYIHRLISITKLDDALVNDVVTKL